MCKTEADATEKLLRNEVTKYTMKKQPVTNVSGVFLHDSSAVSEIKAFPGFAALHFCLRLFNLKGCRQRLVEFSADRCFGRKCIVP